MHGCAVNSGISIEKWMGLQSKAVWSYHLARINHHLPTPAPYTVLSQCKFHMLLHLHSPRGNKLQKKPHAAVEAQSIPRCRRPRFPQRCCCCGQTWQPQTARRCAAHAWQRLPCTPTPLPARHVPAWPPHQLQQTPSWRQLLPALRAAAWQLCLQHSHPQQLLPQSLQQLHLAVGPGRWRLR